MSVVALALAMAPFDWSQISGPNTDGAGNEPGTGDEPVSASESARFAWVDCEGTFAWGEAPARWFEDAMPAEYEPQTTSAGGDPTQTLARVVWREYDCQRVETPTRVLGPQAVAVAWVHIAQPHASPGAGSGFEDVYWLTSWSTSPELVAEATALGLSFSLFEPQEAPSEVPLWSARLLQGPDQDLVRLDYPARPETGTSEADQRVAAWGVAPEGAWISALDWSGSGSRASATLSATGGHGLAQALDGRPVAVSWYGFTEGHLELTGTPSVAESD